MLLTTLVCVQEYVNGQLKNKYGDVFIRGNNGESRLCSKDKLLLSTAVRQPTCARVVGGHAFSHPFAVPCVALAAVAIAAPPAVLYISTVRQQ